MDPMGVAIGFLLEDGTFHFFRRHGEVQVVHDLLEILRRFDAPGGHLWNRPAAMAAGKKKENPGVSWVFWSFSGKHVEKMKH